MSVILDHFERFLDLFGSLKTIAGAPKRLAVFYSESLDIRDAVKILTECATSLEYHELWFGQKRHEQVSAGFEQSWFEYKEQWVPAIKYGELCQNFRDPQLLALFMKGLTYENYIIHNKNNSNTEKDEPDPEVSDPFDPAIHDGGLALTLGIDHWQREVARVKIVANKCQIALGAFDYLSAVIGIDLKDVFRRWREVPTIFVPPLVSNAVGRTAGSLNDLLDDAVRAYVCGAPAAAVVMCRAVLEAVLKTHYLESVPAYDEDNAGREPGLKKIISMAEARHAFLRKLRLSELKEAADTILHKYHRKGPLSAAEGQAIVDYMQTLKIVIQQVEK